MKKVKGKHFWTAYKYRVSHGKTILDGELSFLVPISPLAATATAINKTEFLAACMGLSWDANNITIVLEAQ